MKQDWNHLLFLHWILPTKEIQSQLPEGLFVDTYEGNAYVGIVPFYMEKNTPCLLSTSPSYFVV